MEIVWLIIIKQKRNFWPLTWKIWFIFSLRAHQFWWSWKQWKAARGTYVALTRDQEGAAYFTVLNLNKIGELRDKKCLEKWIKRGGRGKYQMKQFALKKRSNTCLNDIFELNHWLLFQNEEKLLFWNAS